MAKLVDDKTGEIKTPEQLAAEALQDTELIVVLNHNTLGDLDVAARNLNKDALLAARDPQKLWDKMQDDWRNDAIVELIKAKAKIINDYMDAKERKRDAENAYIQHLVSTGMSYTDARKKATGK